MGTLYYGDNLDILRRYLKDVLLTARTEISPGVIYHVRIALADYGDATYDPAVFIRAGPRCQCP